MSEQANISRVLLAGLKERGARAVFGLPGDYVLGFFNEIETADILPLYTLSHEPAVGFAADGAARYGDGSGGRALGVAAVTYGAGAMNLVNTAACAWAEHSPVVFISGAPGVSESAHGMLLHHQIRSPDSQLNVFREVTCAQAVLDDPATAPAEIARVLDECVRRSRPVYIELPRDMVDAPCAALPARGRIEVNEAGLAGCVEDIIEKLSAAHNPVLLAGVGVRRFGLEDDVAEIARELDCTLVSTFMGKGMFARHGDVHRGCYLGLAGDEDLRLQVEDSDCLVMIGVIPCDTNLGVSGKRIDLDRVIAVNNGEVCMSGRVARAIPLNDFCTALKAAIPACKSGPNRKAEAPEPAAGPAPGNQPLRADDIAPVLNAYLAASPGTPVSADVGDCLFMAMGVEGAPVLASGYYATMGFGVPAAMGAQAASGQRPVVLTGDGGFQMTGWELLNCQRFGWGPVVIVLNNQSWEMLRQFQPQAGYTGLGKVSYAALAGPLGGAGERVHTPGELAAALRRAGDHRESFYLIEVMLEDGDTTTTLRDYAGALKKNAAKNNTARA